MFDVAGQHCKACEMHANLDGLLCLLNVHFFVWRDCKLAEGNLHLGTGGQLSRSLGPGQIAFVVNTRIF